MWTYPLYDADFSRRLVFFPLINQQKGIVSDEFREFVYSMKQHEVKYLFVSGPGKKIARQAARNGVLTKLTTYLYTTE